MINLTDVQFDALLKRLHLANARRAWRELVQRAEREEWSYRDFLALLVTEEIAHRQQTRIARMVRRAGFPFFKTIDDFNFSMQSTVRLALLGSALAPDFMTEGRCLVFGGKPGRGKTHLTVAIAYRAIQNGFDAVFVTAAELTHAIVDRILERGRLLTLDGPSMRTRHLGLDDPTANPASTQSASLSGDGARISGIQRPEFPEPTPAFRWW
jgi:DNA replication protein DnaC